MTCTQGELAKQQSNTAGAISMLIFPHASIQTFYIVLENFKSKKMGRNMIFFSTLLKLFCCSILVKSSVESQAKDPHW